MIATIQGQRVEYTGKHGAFFYEVRLLDGPNAGQIKLTNRPPVEIVTWEERQCAS